MHLLKVGSIPAFNGKRLQNWDFVKKSQQYLNSWYTDNCPNGHNPERHNPEWTQSRMDTIPNGHNPEWTPSRMDTIPKGHNPE